jgi:phospholipase C
MPLSTFFVVVAIAALLVISTKSDKPQIDHVVLLVMENRPYDFFFGFSDYLNERGANGLSGKECNTFTSIDGTTSSKSCVENGTAPYVCKNPVQMSRSVYGNDIWGNKIWQQHLCYQSAYHYCGVSRDINTESCTWPNTRS